MIRTKKPNGQELTHKQLIFIKEYIIDFNATRAALAAGYSKKYAGTIGSQNLEREYIKKAIEAEIQKRVQRLEVSQDKVIQELARLAFSDMRSFVEWNQYEVKIKDSQGLKFNESACISEVTQTMTSSGTNIRIRLHDKKGALELLGRHLGMFTDKIELSGQVKQENEHKYHIIQELVSEPDIADRIKRNFRQRTGDIVSPE